MVHVTNGRKVLNYTVRRGYYPDRPEMQFELIWCYVDPDNIKRAGWRFFRSDRAARAFAAALVSGVVNPDGSVKANTGTAAATVAAQQVGA
jgi:hypothetical protein